ncbi:hypothetical protein [Streptomyces showdoensis]|uniref:Uncharacterized protein n=1 Tax=Streptomyces showdoensis TaxID=68268 RepID=A0A2P2GVM3_STREW|nr:hypothetical protein [Streptomyces showdoensis]KKZ75528.1 hypothetical protein VO63_01495 [Streptomyces showdoensis]
MTDHATTAVTTLLAATEQQGPGDTLRIVLLVSIVGGALLAWFLLRGYGSGADDAQGAEDGNGAGGGTGTDGGAASAGNAETAGNGTAEKGAGDANA